MAFEVTNSFIEEFDSLVYPFLQQQGSKLIQAVTQEPMNGGTKYIRQNDVGEAFDVTDIGGITEYTPVMYDRRLLKSRGFVCPISLNEFDMAMQGGAPNPSQLAMQTGNRCGEKLDKIIIAGIGGPVTTEANGIKTLSGADKVTAGATKEALVANYDKTQTIAWNDCTLGGNSNQDSIHVKGGLNASKICKAVQKLQAKQNYGPIICVCSSYAASTLRADHRVASSDFNDIHAFMAGATNSYGGVSAFVTSELLDGGKSKAKNADGTYNANGGADVEYAYVYCMNQIRLGVTIPLYLDMGKNIERYMSQVMMYKGMYGCIRMFEESVVRIEVNKNPEADAAFVY